MKITLSNTPLLSTQQIGELTSSLDNTHSKVLQTIERLNKDVSARKLEIASRWKGALIDDSHRKILMDKELLVAIDTIRKNSKEELDRLFKEAGAAYQTLMAQKPYYDSPVKVLARQHLGNAARTDYTIQLQHAGPAEIASMGQLAAATGNVALAAAVLSRLDAMPTSQRPFTARELASSVETGFSKVNEYLKLAELRFQGVVIAIRTWTMGRANPLNTVSLGLRERSLDHQLLKELDNAIE